MYNAMITVHVFTHAHAQTSREVGILQELHSELESEAGELRNLTNSGSST